MICTEIYKTLNHMGPVHVNNLIIPNNSNDSTGRLSNLFVPRVNQTTNGHLTMEQSAERDQKSSKLEHF